MLYLINGCVFENSIKSLGIGVWGIRLGCDVPQTRHGQNKSPKRSIRRRLRDASGDVAGDALSACRKQGEHVLNIIGFDFRTTREKQLKYIKKIRVYFFWIKF
jgi:hypothetical protein